MTFFFTVFAVTAFTFHDSNSRSSRDYAWLGFCGEEVIELTYTFVCRPPAPAAPPLPPPSAGLRLCLAGTTGSAAPMSPGCRSGMVNLLGRGRLSGADSSSSPAAPPWPGIGSGSRSWPACSAWSSRWAAWSNSSGVISMASCISLDAARTNSGSQYLPRPWSLKTWNKPNS